MQNKTILVDSTNAFAEYAKGSKEVKEVIERLIGKDNLVLDITKRVIDLATACKETGTDINDPKFTRGDDQDNALKELEEIARALRCGVELDYSNSNQKKWFVVMVWDNGASGFRFYDSYYEGTLTHTIGGPRLCLDTQEKATHFGTSPEIVKIWNRFLTKIVK